MMWMGRNSFDSRTSKEHRPADTLILTPQDLPQNPDLQNSETMSLLFEAAKFVVVCKQNNRKFMHTLLNFSYKYMINV